jgi:Zn-dependent protease
MILKKLCEVTRSLFRLILGILPVVFWCCLIYSFDERLGAGITIIAMVIHELGHIACIFLINGKLEAPKSAFNGLRIAGQQHFSYPEQMLQYASGPIFNFIASAVMLLCAGLNEYSETFVAINLATAVSNLLPIEGYDGYRLIEAAISYLDLGFKAYAVLEAVSFFLTATLCIISLFLVYTFGNGYWFMAIFLFATVSKLQKWQNYQNSRK